MPARKKKATKKKPARRAAKKATRETLVVGSKVKNYIKGQGKKCSGDLIEGLSDQLHAVIDAAINRCEGNKRSTVRPVDL